MNNEFNANNQFAEQLWNQTLAQIELQLSQANFKTWFTDTFIMEIKNGCVVLAVPNLFVRDWIYNKYHKIILKILRDISDSIHGLEYQVSKRVKQSSCPTIDTVLNSNSAQQSIPWGQSQKTEDNLNCRYTFENFVIGSFNENAYAATQAILNNPGKIYNPLFIYGNTGYGKTHLIQALGNSLKKKYSGIKIRYITSEVFSTEMVYAFQKSQIGAFKNKYRDCDVFIMDDIQFLSGKDTTQNELFHLFNILYDNDKQIIFSSDRHPTSIQDIPDRLKSRFAQGVMIDVQPPEFESRELIIGRKFTSLGLVMSEDVVRYLAEIVEGNIRELEGVVNLVHHHSTIKGGKQLSLLEVKNVVKNNLVRSVRQLSPEEVVQKVSDYYNVKIEDITGKTKLKEIALPRQVIMYILREDYNIPLTAIGEKIGGRNHTTVMHSYGKIKEDLKTDQKLSDDLKQLRTLMRA